MSRALAADERRKLDAYYTPDALACALVDLLGIGERETVLEPHAGGGAFVRACLDVGASVHAADLNPDAPGLRLVPDHCRTAGDFLAVRPMVRQPPYCGPLEPAWILGNPPYRDAEKHIRRALDVTGRHVAFLLRLGFLESQKRAPFWVDHPCRKVWVLTERPSFTLGGTDSAAYGWFWWDKEHRGPTELGHVSWKGEG